jgi:stage II sporulation protein D
MKLLYKFFLIVCSIFAIIAPNIGASYMAQLPHIWSLKRAIITSSGTLRVHALDRKAKKWITSDRCCTLSFLNGQLHVNGGPVKSKELYVYSSTHEMSLNGTIIKGPMVVRATKSDNLQIIAVDDQEPMAKIVTVEKSLFDEFATTPRMVTRAQQSGKGASLRKETPLIVRVLLDHRASTQSGTWVLRSVGGFVVRRGIRTQYRFKKSDELTITIKNGAVHLNGICALSCIGEIIPASDYVYFNDKPYKGTFVVSINKGAVSLINCIDLEEYTYAVVRSESWPGWPLEVNKVFAIASRSYVMAMMLRAVQTKQAYHIKDTNVHQRYNLYGEHSDLLVKRAVQETAGVCLVFKDQPIVAMFDSCCGGIIPAHIEHFNFRDAPYLARTYPCTFCKASSLYSWQVTYDKATFEHILKGHVGHLKPVKEVKVHTKDKAGMVKEIVLRGNKKQVIVPGKRLYALAKEVKSCYYTIVSKAHEIHIKGRGLGHLLGLCQWGARQMVREGWNYKSILKFYYPGTNLKQFV